MSVRPDPDFDATMPMHPAVERTTPREPAVRRPPNTAPVLPDVTSDERDVGWGEVPDTDDDEHLLREVPPHHGS